MPRVSAPVVKLVQRTTEPAGVQTLRSTAAAVIAYSVAVWFLPEPAPLTAPLTALLVVQVTLYATLTTGIRRVNSVVVGVLIAIGFSSLVGLSWWSLGLTIFTALMIGRLVRVNEFVPEVAISAMLVLGVSQVADTAWDRVWETLIGAVVGLLFNLLLAPPVWVGSAGSSIESLAVRMGTMLRSMGEEVVGNNPVSRAAARLHEARRLDHDIVEVDASLRQAEESLTLNPRVRHGLLHRVVLRTGLDTLEICAVVVRVLSRTLTDLAKARTEEALFPPDVTELLQELFGRLAGRSRASPYWSRRSSPPTPTRRRNVSPTRSPAAAPPVTWWPTCSWRTSRSTRASGSCTAPCSPRSTGSWTSSTSRSAPSASVRNWTAARRRPTPAAPACAHWRAAWAVSPPEYPRPGIAGCGGGRSLVRWGAEVPASKEW